MPAWDAPLELLKHGTLTFLGMVWYGWPGVGLAAPQVGVQQQLPWGGANYTVFWNSARNTTNNIFSSFNPQLSSTLGFNYTQPLLAGPMSGFLYYTLGTEPEDITAGNKRFAALLAQGRDLLNALSDVVPLAIAGSAFNARELRAAGYRDVVVDTAPTGHLVRLLELPDLALEWTHQVMRLLLKYREVVAPGTI